MKRLYIGLALAMIAMLLAPPVALALAPPDTMTVYSVFTVRNTIEAGDVAIVFHFYIDDNSYTEPASNTIMFRLYDTDDVTLISSASPPPIYFGYGYENGVAMFYFSAADNFTWGEPYRLNITGSPAFFDPLPSPFNYYMVDADYATATTQADNQDALGDYVLSVAQLLEIAYPTYSLYGATDTGVILSETGEAYFRQALPGLQAMAPGLFLTQYYVPTVEDMGLDTAQATTYEGRLEDSDIMDGFTALGSEFGVSGSAAAGGVSILLVIGLIIFTARKGWGTTPGILAGMVLLTAGAILLGGALMIVRLVMALIAGILLMYVLFFKRS